MPLPPPSRRLPIALLLAPLLLLAGAQCAPPPHSETREPCRERVATRQPFFGELQIQTGASFDGAYAGVRNRPRDAYRFALGEEIPLPPDDLLGRPTRSARLARPLDFAVVTDHAEYYGETRVCTDPKLPGYDDPLCVSYRADIDGVDATGTAFQRFAFQLIAGVRFAFCLASAACESEADRVWREMQDAAEEFYDRSAACRFTTFVGYEWTGNEFFSNLHRVVVFRNAVVPERPASVFEAYTPDALWDALETECIESGSGCDAITIAHNSNLSDGRMFSPTNSDGTQLTAADAARRARLEPLVEVTQHKGDSECATGVGTDDPLCGFEKLSGTRAGSGAGFPPLSFARNALKEGLRQQQQTGVDPFRFGLIGATDSHNADAGMTEEEDFAFAGHLGWTDATAAGRLAPTPPRGVETNPGGLAVVWAPENSRDALFEAMRRREVYATSGTRPIVRFFGGWSYPEHLCRRFGHGDRSFARLGYALGVPMGSELPPPSDRAPRFAVRAQSDAGTRERPGGLLQRIQIVKGWVDGEGGTHEQVYDVAGDAENGATVDTDRCEPSGSGWAALCAVWEDPDFDPGQGAFYYARVVENPSCRWSTFLCNAEAVDCADPGSVPAGIGQCCNPAVPKTIQERAVTSPIWYTPRSG